MCTCPVTTLGAGCGCRGPLPFTHPPQAAGAPPGCGPALRPGRRVGLPVDPAAAAPGQKLPLAEIRRQIAEGTYLTDEKLAIAIARLWAELVADRDGQPAGGPTAESA